MVDGLRGIQVIQTATVAHRSQLFPTYVGDGADILPQVA
jgi:hypothetical protein